MKHPECSVAARHRPLVLGLFKECDPDLVFVRALASQVQRAVFIPCLIKPNNLQLVVSVES